MLTQGQRYLSEKATDLQQNIVLITIPPGLCLYLHREDSLTGLLAEVLVSHMTCPTALAFLAASTGPSKLGQTLTYRTITTTNGAVYFLVEVLTFPQTP